MVRGDSRLADVLTVLWVLEDFVWGLGAVCISRFLGNPIPNIQIYWSRMIIFHTCKAICLQIELER